MLLNIDHKLYQLINQKFAFEWLDNPMTMVSDKSFWIIFYCVVIFYVTKVYKKKGLLFLLFIITASSISDSLTSRILKPSIKRTRPCHEVKLTPRILSTTNCSETGSLPSSHASNSFVLAVMMIIFYGVSKTSNTVFWLLWASIISYSRVYLGVHYVSDVIIGAILGTLIAILFYNIYEKTLIKLKWD